MSEYIGSMKLFHDYLHKCVASGGRVNIGVMKLITGYTGLHNSGKATDSAIWRYNNREVQSIVIDMNTLETWVSFQPEGQPLHSPNCIQSSAAILFEGGL